MNVSELPKSEHPDVKARYFGMQYLSNAELITLLTGTKDISAPHKILKDFGGLSGLRAASVEDFISAGVPKSTAMKIAAASELSLRYSKVQIIDRPRIFSASDIADLLMEEMRHLKQEHVKSVLLNAKYNVIHIENVSKGGIVSANIEARDVYREAVKRGATGLIIVHNHPSGDPAPSEDDIYSTRVIEQAGGLINIKLIDHIIIGNGRFISLRDQNLLDYVDPGIARKASEAYAKDKKQNEQAR